MAAEGPGGQQHAIQLRVLQQNIGKDTGQLGQMYPFAKRRHVFLDLVLARQPDVISIQEATADQIAWLDKQFPLKRIGLDPYSKEPTPTLPGDKYDNISNLIYYNEELLTLVQSGAWYLWHNPRQHYVRGNLLVGYTAPRYVTWAQFRLNGTRKNHHIFVLCTHLEIYSSHRETNQANMASLIKLMNELHIKDRDAGFVVCGDFNMTRSDKSYAMITSQFADACTNTNPELLVPDPRTSPVYFSHHRYLGTAHKRSKEKDQIVDYVFFRRDTGTLRMRVRKAEIVLDWGVEEFSAEENYALLKAGKQPKIIWPSDHYAVYVIFAIYLAERHDGFQRTERKH